jgi:hypothetical protein
MLITGLMIACASPVNEGDDEEEPIVVTYSFIGTWKNMTYESFGYNVGFTFKDDGTYDYWHSFGNISGSGNYTYNNERLIFSNGIITDINGTYTNISTNLRYEWIIENQFRLTRDNNDAPYFADGRYVKQ